ncbi:ltrC-like domain protein [[Clostridium] sordellii ATCC 9714]|nr:ltrC-like domain protein [[Clostridium] sordellii ATCC 9714] [Paeniclostridium sordellii ATCC 9714]
MKINTELIKKTLNDYKKDILDICTSDNITIDTLSTKIESIKDNVNTFSTLSLFIDDPTFVKETTALSLISERLIENQFDFFENKDFKSSLSDSLCNMGIDLNTDPTPSNDNLNNYIVDNDINKEIQNTVDNNSNPVESEINLNNKNEVKDKKELSKSLNDLTPKEKVDLLVETANDTISSYFQSPEDMKKYLDFMSKFYKYSPRNIALIENQFMVAKAVGSFKFWKDNGFTVNKGEKGIKILVPTKENISY